MRVWHSMRRIFNSLILATALLVVQAGTYAQGLIDCSDYDYDAFEISIISPNPTNQAIEQMGNTEFDLPPGDTDYLGGWIGNTLGSPGPGVGATPANGPGGYNYQLSSNFEVGIYFATSLSALTDAIIGGVPVTNTIIGSGEDAGLYGTPNLMLAVPGMPAGTEVFVGIAAWYSGGGASSYAAATGDGIPCGYVESTRSVALGSPINPTNLVGIGLTSFSLSHWVDYLEPRLVWTNPPPIIYGTALSSNQLNATANVGCYFVYNPTYGAVPNAGTNVLFLHVTPFDTSQYAPESDNVNLVVSPAPLTVTASNATRAFGVANPAFMGTLTGVTNNDNITANYTCSATANSPPGTYPITPTLLDPDSRLTNYAVTINNGTLTVVEPPNILATVQSGNSFTFTWSATSNQMYQIQSTTDLGQANWINLTGAITASNSTVTISEPISTSNSVLFYRIVLLP
jgi:MBG domain (YGX type)